MTKISNQYSLTNILTADLANSRLGINNVSPAYSLDLTGTARVTGQFNLINSNIINSDANSTNVYHTFNRNLATGYEQMLKWSTAGVAKWYIGLQSGTSDSFGIYSEVAARNAITITSAGNVGIGTTSPLQTTTNRTVLTVNGTNQAIINLGYGGNLAAYLYTDNTNYSELYSYGQLNFVAAGSQPMTFTTTGGERMRITSGGNVGIGVTPSAWGSGTTALQIGTTSSLWNRASDNLLVLVANSYFNGSSDIQISTGTSNRMYFVSGGTYFERAASTAAGSGTPWTSSMVISANGSIGAPSGTNIYNASDARLKKNISTTTYGLDTISSLNPVKFNWIDGFEPTEDGKDMLGFVAQEVQAVLPEAIESFGGNSITIGDTVIDNPLRVNEKFIIPVLVKAIQELSAKVSLLENK